MIDRALRLIGTAISFFAFGLGGLLLTLLIFPVVVLVSPSRTLRIHRVRSIIGFTFRVFLALMEGLRVLDLQIEDTSALAADEGTLVLANHPSLIDVIMLLAYIPQGNCVVKSDLWSNPFLWGVVRAAGYVSNDEGPGMLDAAAQALQAGDTLVVFPEATRTVPGRPMHFRRGAANIALKARAPVRLVHLDCYPTTLTKAESWYTIPPSRPCFRLRVGDRLDASQFVDNDGRMSIASRRLTQVLHDQLSEDVFADARA
jgi:1-acyl-sn-glycerol-3-phosphate acyltransferase